MSEDRTISRTSRQEGPPVPTTRGSLWPRGISSAIPGAEVVFLLGFLLYHIWVPIYGSTIDAWPSVLFFMLFTISSAWLHGDRAADLGIRLDTFWRALGEAVVVIAPALLLAFIIGRYLEGGRTLTLDRFAGTFIRIYPWALFQQYGLQCFLERTHGFSLAPQWTNRGYGWSTDSGSSCSRLGTAHSPPAQP